MVPTPSTPQSQSPRRGFTLLCVGVALMAVVFCVLAALVWHANEPVRLDRLVFRLNTSSGLGRSLGGDGSGQAESGDHFAAAMSLGAKNTVGILAVVLLVLALWWRDLVSVVIALLGPVSTGVLTEFVAKPFINDPGQWGGRQFPSGHAGGVTAIAVAALVVAYRHWGVTVALALTPVAAMAVAAVGLGLVGRNLHYPTDVAGGIALGGTVVLGLTAVCSLNAWRGEQLIGRLRHLLVARGDAVTR